MKRLSQWSRSGRGKKAPCSACFACQLSWLSLNTGGQGFLPATVGILPPATFIGNKRKIKPKAGHSSCSNTRQLISFTQQLEILVTALLLCSTMCDCMSMPLTATVHNNRGLSGGQVLPYISHIVMCPPPPPPPKSRDFALFWSENRYRLYSFWSGIRYGLRELRDESVWANILFQFQMSKKRRDMQIRNGFCCCSNLNSDDIIS